MPSIADGRTGSIDPASVVDYLVQSSQASSAAELNRLTLQVVQPFGIAGAACSRIARPGSPIRPQGLIADGCRDWGEAYLREGCVRADPAIEHIFANQGPFTWSSLRGRKLSPAEERVFGVAADFGFEDGLVTPVLGQRGDVGAVVFVSDCRLDLRPGDETLLGAVAAAYATRGAALIGEPRSTPAPLSARERQCLAWAAQGKSDSLTSEILELSEKTVRMHVENARRKLGVHSRHQAVLEAWRQGWLIDDAG